MTAAVIGGQLVVTIDDDGKGFGPGTLGYGVEGMIERARMVGGRVDLERPAGGGARIRFETQARRPRDPDAAGRRPHDRPQRSQERARARRVRIEVVGEAAGVKEALDKTRALKPEIVVLDLTLRDGSGLDVIADMRAEGARIVILSMQDEPAYARKAFELGAQGYVVKDAAEDRARGRDRHGARRPHVRASLDSPRAS